jgi:integrase
MKGSRPLTEAEVQTISRSFTGVFAPRNQALFMVGHRTGFRISELLSLTVGDVQANGKVMERITVSRRHMKGKASGRTVPLHAEARAALSVWLEVLQKRLKGHLDPLTLVFCSRVKDPSTGLRRAISREQGWRILHDAFAAHGLEGKLGTHAMRKTFCNRVYEALRHDLVKTQRAMGHANINSTVQYLSFREEDITDAILGVRMVA